MNKSINLLMQWVCVGLLSGCIVAPPTIVSTKSYFGKDFVYTEDGDYKNIVLLLPSNVKEIRELSNYRGVYGAFVETIKSDFSPFNKLKCLVDWDGNATKYTDKKNILVRIKLNDYGLNPAKDATTCVSIETTFSVFPFSDNSRFIYDGANCGGLTDIRVVSQTYMSHLSYVWNTEHYATHLVQFSSWGGVSYSEVVDKMLGFPPIKAKRFNPGSE